MRGQVSEKKCRIEGCKRPYRAKGYCEAHYKKWRWGELPKPRYKTCVMEGCRKKRTPSGLCEEHQKAKSQEGATAAAQPAEGAPPTEAPAPPPAVAPSAPENPPAA